MMAKSKSTLPELTQQPIRLVNSFPDKDYPLRILRSYRENCNCRWTSNFDDPFIESLNEMNDKRAKLLDGAIEILERVTNA